MRLTFVGLEALWLCGFLLLTNYARRGSTSETVQTDQLEENDGSKGLNFFGLNFNNETQVRGIRMPCECRDGECGCCSGNILENFNIHMRQHLCINMTYEPEDLSVGVRMSINDIVLLSNRISGRNPPPLCINIPRLSIIKFCGRFSNVYFVGRNIHACVTLETEWNERTVFSYSFDCVRLGLDGVAIVSAEDGGGLPHPIDQEVDNIEEYDELLENQTTKKPVKKVTKRSTKGTTSTTEAASTDDDEDDDDYK